MDIEHFIYETRPWVIGAIGFAAMTYERANSFAIFFGIVTLVGAGLIIFARFKNRGYL